MKIIVIDDDEMTVVALAEKLKEKGYEVLSCLNGVEALKIINDEKIDLIICDVMMPAISGFELLIMLRNFYLSNIPLLLMSGYKDDRVLDISRSFGVRTFITKPVDYEELFKKIEEIAADKQKTTK